MIEKTNILGKAIGLLGCIIILFLFSDTTARVEGGIIATACLMITFAASSTMDNPSKSPIVWLLCGLVIIIGFGYDTVIGFEFVNNPLTAERIPNAEDRDVLNAQRTTQFVYSIMKTVIGAVMVGCSAWMIKSKKSEPEN